MATEALQDASDRRDAPRVSFAILAFNQQDLIGDAVAGALAQDYDNLEIVIADDESTDATRARIDEAVATYKGPHTVRVLERCGHLGIARNFQRLVEACAGDFIVYAEGDDVSEPGRTRALVDAWRAAGARTTMLLSSFTPIDAQSHVVERFDEVEPFHAPRIEDLAAGRIRGLGAVMGFTPDVFARFPALAEDVVHVDRVIPFRVMLLGGVIGAVDENLVRYRIHGGVSRGKAVGGRAYLTGSEPRRQRRLLADARQRLADLKACGPASLEPACAQAVENHLTFLAFSDATPLRYEQIALDRAGRDRETGRILKTWLKFRFLPLFDIFYRAARTNK